MDKKLLNRFVVLKKNFKCKKIEFKKRKNIYLMFNVLR